ncbi:MAG TPA: amino acid adenylation domain-containing protein, partial [Gemmatimonadaceae bacterium]|nr:amino acid adenylation domain-containing protein [Gemmatimonadaceae bacterium]
AHDVQQRAATLHAAGVAAGHAVAFAQPRSVDAVVRQLAILHCGAAYVPLDPHGPAPRWERMLRRLAVARPLHVEGDDEDALTTTARACGVPIIRDDRRDAAQAPSLEQVPPPDIGSADHAAYVMFTSGSTGEPKGVVVPHRAVQRLVEDVDYVRLGPGRVLLHAAPLAFDASTFEIWGALLTGGCCVVHDETIPTAAGLGRAIRAHGVTTLWLTAGLFNAIIDEDPTQLAPLDELLIGGEALSVSHVRRALAALPTTTIINGYGPTETTTFAATWRIPRSLPADATSVPIGVALPRTTLQVCDDAGRVVPDGELGELRIGGDGVALGYLIEEAGMPSPFVPDPQQPSRRQYRTGDLVRRRDDGALEYVGRRDAQLKIGGHRIEPAEIERVLAGVAGVAAAAVVAVPRGEAGAVQLVAFLVPAGTQPVEVDVVRQTARAELPAPMVPTDVRLVTQLPLTANGKLDRRALVVQASASAPDATPSLETPQVASPQDAAPQDDAPDLTAQLCADWSALLGTTVAADTNVFEAGATSLLVVRFVARLSARTGREIAAITCFEHPTPRRLATALRGSGASANAAPLRSAA